MADNGIALFAIPTIIKKTDLKKMKKYISVKPLNTQEFIESLLIFIRK